MWIGIDFAADPLMRLFSLFILCFGLLFSGCAAPQSADRLAEANRPVPDSQIRVASIGNNLLTRLASTGYRLEGCHIRFVLIPGDRPGAWVGSCGVVRVNTALARMLNDDELAAAMAHELGHLVDQRCVKSTLALEGVNAQDKDIEMRADRIGCAILVRCGYSARSMTSMLTKFAEAYSDNPNLKANILSRVKQVTTNLNM